MRRRRHPLSGAIYEVRVDGLLDVSLEDKVGVFTPQGGYVSGDVHHADPHLCGWLAGPQVPANMAKNPKDLPSIAAQRAAVSAGGSR